MRLRYDEQTQDYAARRTAEGKTKMEIIRCLKRYLVRQLYPLIVQTLQPRPEAPGLWTWSHNLCVLRAGF